jgi:hypothetical protein
VGVGRLTNVAALAALSALAVSGCALDDGRPPLARISIDPPSIVENDGMQTPVTLDGTASADPLDDPEGDAPLSYRWQILDDEFDFVDSRETSPRATVRLRGDRPATIVLTVSDRDGLEAVAVEHMRLTVN